jgi:hypothetical protein
MMKRKLLVTDTVSTVTVMQHQRMGENTAFGEFGWTEKESVDFQPSSFGVQGMEYRCTFI